MSEEPKLNYETLGRDQLLGELRWRDKIIADAKRERAGLIAQMERSEVLLNEAGVQDDHHGEERPLTLDERVECLVAKIDEMQSELDDQGNAYISAVQERKTFREAYRGARASVRHCADVLEELDAEIDRQVYLSDGRDNHAFHMRDVGQDLPSDYEHHVVITEAMVGRIREAVKICGLTYEPQSTKLPSSGQHVSLIQKQSEVD